MKCRTRSTSLPAPRPLQGRAKLCAAFLCLAGGCAKSGEAPNKDPAPQVEAAPKVQDWEGEYRSVKSKSESWDPKDAQQLQALNSRLRAIVEHAEDPHLRANACILAASLYDQAKDYKTALSYYRQVIALLPQEPSGYSLSALALAAMHRYPEAARMQEELVRRDPDDLQGWLLLGELHMRAKQPEEASKAYAAYETRRSGLLEGLTRKNAKGYVLSAQERADCVHALAAAPDAGTSLALVYALEHDPDARVRGALIEVMQAQRFVGYLQPLRDWSQKESDASLRPRLKAAIAAIEAEPVKTRPEPGDIQHPSPDPDATPGAAEGSRAKPKAPSAKARPAAARAGKGGAKPPVVDRE